jgi:hypothetical protein
MAERLWPCHFCGVLMPVDQAEFYRLLPAGFADCGECSKNWGILFKNVRPKVTRRFLRRQEEAPDEPAFFFTPDDIPLEHSLIAAALSGAIAKAEERHRGNAIGDLLKGLTYGGLGIVQAVEWGKASWLPPIAPPDPDDAFVKHLDEPSRSVANVDRALLGLHGLFAGYSVLMLAMQARVGDGKTRLGNLFVDECFGGDADQFAGVILPHFYSSGQRLYWAFRDKPRKAHGAPIMENLALVFQYPLIERAITSLSEAAEHGLDIDVGEFPESMVRLDSLFSSTFAAINDEIVKRGTHDARNLRHSAGGP